MTAQNSFRLVPDKISFDKPLESIRYFRKQWDCYCKETGIENHSEESKLNHLYLLIGREAFQVISGLSLNPEEKKDSEKLLNALENFYKPIKYCISERYRFNLAVQEENEEIDSYVKRLRELASSCEYGENVEDMIRDRFVVGLKNMLVQQELIAEPKLTLQKAIFLTKLRLQTDANTHTLHPKLNYEKDDFKNDGMPKIEQITGTALRQVQIKLEKIEHIENPSPVDAVVKLDVAPSVCSSTVIQHQEISSVKEVTNTNECETPNKRLKVDIPSLNASKMDTLDTEENSEKKTSNIVKNNSCAITCGTDYSIGCFLVLKTDYHNESDPPLWKIDTNSLLQKFEPFDQDGMVLYKSKPIYSGWSQNSRNQYYRTSVLVKGKQFSRKDCVVVQFLKDSVEQVNAIERNRKSSTPCDKKNDISKKH